MDGKRSSIFLLAVGERRQLSVDAWRRGDARVVMLGQEVGELLVGRFRESGFLPQIRRQVRVGLGDGGVSRLGKVAQCRGGTASLRVAVLDTSHVEQLLGHTSGDDTSSARSGNQTHNGATALACNFAGYGVGFTDLVSPVASADRDNRQLGENDSASDGSGHLLGAFDAETNVAVVISNGDKSLEPRSLTGTSLLLDGHDLQDLVLQARAQEIIDDFAFLDRKGEEVNLLQRFDLSIFHEASQFGDGDPLFLLFLAASTTTASATTTASTPAASSSVSETASKTSTVSTGWCCVRHWWILSF